MSFYGMPEGRRVTMRDLAEATVRGEKWPMITAYDAMTARIFDEAGIPALLVGDSAAMVVYGHDSTLPVTVDELVPLVRAVVRGAPRAVVIADLPFGSYQASPAQALETAARFMKEGGAHAVKLEGGAPMLPQVEALAGAGIPVIGHLGLTPQSVNLLGGYRVQGRGEAGETLMRDAKAMEAAGAFAVVLEVVPAELAARVSEVLTIPTIGIGAGSGTDAQVIVWQDLVGLTPQAPKFVKRYADVRTTIADAVAQWGDGRRHRRLSRSGARVQLTRVHPAVTTGGGCDGRCGLGSDVGDADAGVHLVAPVHRDQVGRHRLDLARVAQPAAVDAADAGDPAGQRLDQVGRLAVVAEHEHVGVDRVDGLVEQQHGGDVVEGGHDATVDEDARRLLRG